MKKAPISCFFAYGLIGFTTVLATSSSALTQVRDNAPIQQTPIPATNLIWPTQGVMSQGFRKYQHEGIDIAGALGTPIVAAAAGTVTKAGWDDWGLGNAVEIKHPDGSVTVYGHNRRLLVTKGQQVNQGQIIAEMGSTGHSTGSHLHFEFYPNGRVAADPLRTLALSTASKTPSQKISTTTFRSRSVSTPQTVQQVLPPQPITVGSAVDSLRTPTSVTASKIPSGQISTTTFKNSSVSSAPIPITVQQVSPPQSTVGLASVNIDTGCNGVTVIEGETANVTVKVCQENGELFYIGHLKQYPSQLVKLPAWNVGKDRYRADNGSFSYLVSPDKVEVWRNGSQIRSDSFYTFNKF